MSGRKSNRGGKPSPGAAPASTGQTPSRRARFAGWGVGIAVAAAAIAGGLLLIKREPTGDAKPVERPYEPRPPGTLTYNRDIAPIIFENCSWCHRAGQSAPFELLTHADVTKHLADIGRVTASRFMPPWLPEPGYGEFADVRRLSAEELGMLQQWVQEGGLEGDPADAPEAPEWPSDWQLGKPDMVVAPEPFTLAAEGRDVYFNFVVPIPLRENRFVRGIEFRPGNPKVVHHAFIEIDRSREARRLGEGATPVGFYGMETPESVIMPGGQLLGWQPGKVASFSPPGLSWQLHTNTDLVLQVHMNPSGKEEQVRPLVGIHFTEDSPTNSAFRLKLTALELEIPPGASNYVAEESYTLPVDLSLTRVGAHAHYICREMQSYAILPDGVKKWLLWIKDWNFDWQGDYGYANPVELPKGSRVVMRYIYDNSSANIRNPFTPPRHIRYGLQSTDEMGELYFQTLPRSQADHMTLAQDYSQYFLGVSIRYYTHLLNVDPRDARAHKRLGRAMASQGKIQEGVEHIKRAIALQPRDDEAHYDLGSIYLRMGRIADAYMEFAEVVKLNPRDYQALGSLGIICLQAGKTREAEILFNRALQVNPEDALAKKYLEIIRSTPDR